MSIVYLVGAGPGDPKLITVKGLECLQKADVIVYDRLVSPRLLEQCLPDAEKIFVGKEPGRHAMSQEDINQLLVTKAREGKTVCRLKGGDPFIFGRGGEEAEALAEAGVRFEIVPGVTSAIAAPSYAGIPVTHRDFASSVAFVTGHRKSDDDDDDDDEDDKIAWDKIAPGVDTLIFFMGVRNLPFIVEQLTKHGRSPQTPVAIIRWGTTAEQETLTGTLSDIVAASQQRQLKPPALIVVGEVVRLHEKLRWFDVKPLFGKRVVVTRAREQASEFAAKLEALGAEVIQCPVIKIAELESYNALDMAISYLKEYDWLIFTSVNGVDAFFKRLNLQGKDVTALVEKQVCAIGPATAQRLQEMGVYVDLVPEKFVAESVAEGLQLFGMEGKRVLLPRALEAREVLPQMLEEMGAQVDVVPAYRTVLDDSRAELIREQLLSGSVDFITFTSSSTVKNFVRIVGRDILERTRGTFKIASIGPITSQTARELGFTVDVEAREFTVEGLVEAMVS